MEKEAEEDMSGIAGIARISRDLLGQPQAPEPLSCEPPLPDIYSWPQVQVSQEMLSELLPPDATMDQDLNGKDLGDDAGLLGSGSTTIVQKRSLAEMSRRLDLTCISGLRPAAQTEDLIGERLRPESEPLPPLTGDAVRPAGGERTDPQKRRRPR